MTWNTKCSYAYLEGLWKWLTILQFSFASFVLNGCIYFIVRQKLSIKISETMTLLGNDGKTTPDHKFLDAQIETFDM